MRSHLSNLFSKVVASYITLKLSKSANKKAHLVSQNLKIIIIKNRNILSPTSTLKFWGTSVTALAQVYVFLTSKPIANMWLSPIPILTSTSSSDNTPIPMKALVYIIIRP